MTKMDPFACKLFTSGDTVPIIRIVFSLDNKHLSNVCNMIQACQKMIKMGNPFSRRTTSGAREWARACFNQLTKTGLETNGQAYCRNPGYRRMCSWHRAIRTCGG